MSLPTFTRRVILASVVAAVAAALVPAFAADFSSARISITTVGQGDDVVLIPPGVTDERIDALYGASYAPLKGVTLKRIPASAHFIMWDQSAQFQSEVKGFLGRTTR